LTIFQFYRLFKTFDRINLEYHLHRVRLVIDFDRTVTMIQKSVDIFG
jgi:hypothetical protein